MSERGAGTPAVHGRGEGLRVFVGTDDTQLVPAIVLAESIQASARGRITSRVFFMHADRGDLLEYRHQRLEPRGALPLRPYERPRRSGTRFSLARFCVPQLAGTGRALYLDSDQLCLGDIVDLWQHPVGLGGLALCRSRRGGADAEDQLDTSVMVVDADRCRLRVEAVLQGFERGRWDYWEVMCLSGRARELRGGAVAELDAAWNTFDGPAAGAKLLHYTTRETQPWKNDLLAVAARAPWEQALGRVVCGHPLLADLLQQGIRAGFLKRGLAERMPRGR